MAEMDSTIILEFEAKTAKAEEKIKRLSATLSTEAGRAMTATQAHVKKLESEVKRSQMSMVEAGNAMKSAWGKMLGPIALVNQAIQLGGKVFGALGKAVGFLSEKLTGHNKALKEFDEHLKLVRADLKPDEILRFNTALGLVGNEMGVVSEAESHLAMQGFGQATENAHKLMAAMRSGNEGALKEFGVTMTVTGNATMDASLAMGQFQGIIARTSFNRIADEARAYNDQLDRLAQSPFAAFFAGVRKKNVVKSVTGSIEIAEEGEQFGQAGGRVTLDPMRPN